jgi:hypothetical protein
LNIQPKDYVVAVVGAKNMLVQVSSASAKRGTITGLSEAQPGEEPEPVKLLLDDVMAVLGPEPKFGTVFGVKIEPYRGSKDTPMGRIDFHRKLSPVERKNLMKACSAVYKRTKGTSIGKLWPLDHIEIRPKQGKYAGSYKHFGASTLAENRDIITLRPEIFDRELSEYMIWHETAHGVWYHMVPQKVKARWITAYSRRLSLSKIDDDQLKTILHDIEREGSVGGYLSTVEDEEKTVVREVLKNIKRVHRLDKNNLDLLLFQNKSIAEFWPTYYELSEPSVIDVSEYAMTKVEEFFAECVAWQKVGRKMPKAIEKLLQQTLSRLVTF